MKGNIPVQSKTLTTWLNINVLSRNPTAILNPGGALRIHLQVSELK